MQMKKIFDVVAAVILSVIFFVPCCFVALAIRFTSQGPALYWSKRVGQHNKIFSMPKFRSMRIDTPTTATHLLESPEQYLTPIGDFLRRSSVDELPQIWCLLTGEMSLVGPRPGLDSQADLIALRTENNIHTLKPGITGLAQVRGRDELSIPKKVEIEIEYLQNKSFAFDIKILLMTVSRVLKRDGVTH